MRERVEQGLFLEGGEAGAEEGSFRLLAEKGHSGAGYGKDFLFGHDDCGGPSVRAPVADQRATEPLRGRTGGEFPFVPRRHAGPWARHAVFRQRACRRSIRRSCVAIGRRFARGDRGIQYDSLCAPYRRPAHPDGHDPREPDHGLRH